MNRRDRPFEERTIASRKGREGRKGFGESPDHHPSSGIALVVTLLMLSVITFLAIAFLAMTHTGQSAVTTALDQSAAKAASDAALNRAQAEIIAQMMAHLDILSYDYMASHNFINPYGFTNNDPVTPDTNNVNYDYFVGANGAAGPPMNSANRATANAWVQNIANLYFDPRPPVFVQTNFNANAPADFRFWVDINRNGQFETNGYAYPWSNGVMLANAPYTYFNGEPEWIGGLQYPELPHSATNRFLMRYAYLVAPIGKTLDLNFIHNYAAGGIFGNMTATPPDHFVRDQGVGSWEINLGAYLHDLNTNYYVGLASQSGFPYVYGPGMQSSLPYNTGWCFQDAFSLLSYRYNSNYSISGFMSGYPQTVAQLVGPNGTAYFENDWIDEYSASPSLKALYPTNADPDGAYPGSGSRPWAGGYSTNRFYDPMQDLFNSAKTSFNSTNSGRIPLLAWAGNQTDSYDRYTFQRLMASLGTGSGPELQTYVYDPNVTNYMPATFSIPNSLIPIFSLLLVNGATNQTPPTILRTKVNINYDNSAQIAANLNASPTNLVYWTQLGFFTNAADILLRSQEFVLTNQLCVLNTYSNAYIHFGINRIPVYNSTNSSVRYSARIHRMLQLAANIYDASVSRARNDPITGGTNVSPNGVYFPSVFRPIFSVTNINGAQLLYIAGYTNDVQNAQVASAQLYGTAAGHPVWRDPTDPLIQPNDNVWGVPWVVGAVKGLPAFNQYAIATSVSLTRKLEFPVANEKPTYTNQFYLMSISNVIGAEAWNSYSTAFPDNVGYQFSNCVSFVITNAVTGSQNWGTNFVFTNRVQSAILANQWPGWPGGSSSAGFTNILLANVSSLPLAYYSLSSPPGGAFLNLSNYPNFLAGDKRQMTYPPYQWVVNMTNRVFYALYDFSVTPPRLLDFVNLGPFGSSLNILQQIGQRGPSGGVPPVSGAAANNNTADSLCWLQTQSPIAGMPQGVYNQMQIGMGNITISDYAQNPTAANTFSNNLAGKSTNTAMTSFDCPFNPSIVENQYYYLEANDPLVHYTVDDLSWPELSVNFQELKPVSMAYNPLTLTNNGTVNQRYEPWGFNNQALAENPTFIDPGVTRSDLWNFPTNKFPSIGWLGRVHRGTPWQTIFLKADANPGGAVGNYANWTQSWVTNSDSYPTNDYALLDLFTAVPNDNAACGLLSVNQTNQAAWSALLSGVIGFYGVGPTNGAAIQPGDVSYYVDTPTNGINPVRAAQRNGIFHHLGDILNAPTLTIQSPFVINATGPITDDVVERIPEQILGLLKVGQPQFVIYSWGQALRPKDLYLGGGPNFNICTNYQITAEWLTRTVCHVVGDPFAANPKIQIDSKNPEPAN
jgi:hypothetical protein